VTQEEWDLTQRGPFYLTDDSPEFHTILMFPRVWIGTILPKEWKHPDRGGVDQTRCLVVEYLDTESDRLEGLVYEGAAIRRNMSGHPGLVIPTPYWPMYEEYSDEYGNTSLHRYFYQEHECACHRKMVVSGAYEEYYGDLDDECEGDRFKILGIYAPEFLPGINLFSEVLTEDEMYRTVLGDWIR
jgi:hypothetical protein